MTRKTLWSAAALVVAAGLFAAPALAQDEGSNPGNQRPQGQDGGGGGDRGGPGGGGDRGGPGGGGRGGRGGRGWGAIPVEELKKDLGLSDDQVKKLEALNDTVREEFRKAREEMQNGGDFDPQKMRERMQEGRKKLQERISALLTDEQKAKYAEIVKKEDERMSRGPQFGPNPEQMKKRLFDQAEKELTLSPEEKAAVMPLVQKLLDVKAEVRVAGEKRRDEFKTWVRKADSSTDAQKAEIAAKLGDYRKAVEEDRKKVKDAEQALRDVLTVDNEAKLVGIGVLLAE